MKRKKRYWSLTEQASSNRTDRQTDKKKKSWKLQKKINEKSGWTSREGERERQKINPVGFSFTHEYAPITPADQLSTAFSSSSPKLGWAGQGWLIQPSLAELMFELVCVVVYVFGGCIDWLTNWLGWISSSCSREGRKPLPDQPLRRLDRQTDNRGGGGGFFKTLLCPELLHQFDAHESF